MDTLQWLLNKHLGKVVNIRFKDGSLKALKITQIDFFGYKLRGHDNEHRNQIINMKDILWIKQENSSPAGKLNEESSKQQ